VKMLSHDPEALVCQVRMRPLLVNPETSVGASVLVDRIVAYRSVMRTNWSLAVAGHIYN
jgi:hypothetical protein